MELQDVIVPFFDNMAFLDTGNVTLSLAGLVILVEKAFVLGAKFKNGKNSNGKHTTAGEQSPEYWELKNRQIYTESLTPLVDIQKEILQEVRGLRLDMNSRK